MERLRNLGSITDAVACLIVLRLWQSTCMPCGPSSLPAVVDTSLTKDMQGKPFSVGMVWQTQSHKIETRKGTLESLADKTMLGPGHKIILHKNVLNIVEIRRYLFRIQAFYIKKKVFTFYVGPLEVEPWARAR